jgi:hypothetical protein
VTKISKDLPVAELAALVCQHLANHRIEAVLTGGAVVTIYSENEYQSNDLDFISTAREKLIDGAMKSLGFARKERYYVHPDTDFFVEFPAPPLAIGNEPVRRVGEQRLATGLLKLLTPTQCVMDRLAAFYYWNDQQAFRQAQMVARRHTVDWDEIRRWSTAEGQTEKFTQFRKQFP